MPIFYSFLQHLQFKFSHPNYRDWTNAVPLVCKLIPCKQLNIRPQCAKEFISLSLVFDGPSQELIQQETNMNTLPQIQNPNDSCEDASHSSLCHFLNTLNTLLDSYHNPIN